MTNTNTAFAEVTGRPMDTIYTMLVANHKIEVNATSITDYCETALNVAEKLHNEYFKPIKVTDDDDAMLEVQLDKVINSYDYLSYSVQIIRDALKQIKEGADIISETVDRNPIDLD